MSTSVEVRLPDGSTKEVPEGTTAGGLAALIGSRLAKAALVATVDGHLVDLSTPLSSDSQVAIVTADSPEGRDVLRHSTAQHALVRIGRDEGALLVEVLDDGQAKPTVSTGGHGLLGMRERVAAFGGTCEAGLLPGGGWRIRARIPIGQEER